MACIAFINNHVTLSKNFDKKDILTTFYRRLAQEVFGSATGGVNSQKMNWVIEYAVNGELPNEKPNINKLD